MENLNCLLKFFAMVFFKNNFELYFIGNCKIRCEKKIFEILVIFKKEDELFLFLIFFKKGSHNILG